MRILLAHFKIQDWGGIVNYSEFLARGFKELGHTVDPVMLKNTGATGYHKGKDRSLDSGWEYGPGLGLWMHQKNGWEGMYQFNYRTDNGADDWEALTASYDLVIYIVPVPTCSKQNKGDDTWLSLFQSTFTPQVSVIHDGNMQKLYPYILETVPYLEGVICVHDAAYNSAEVLPVNRALIPNPHENHIEDILLPCEREDGFVSMQTFKRWKRVDDLIRAIPHMDDMPDKIICGGGIEYYYMTSKNKCKKEYMDEQGNRIWDNAVTNGMEFLGYVDTAERDNLLRKYKLLIDPSWSHNYSKLGAHFNRVMVEAMSLGCVPVCTDLGMKNSSFFTAGENYIEIPYDISPEGYAGIIDQYMQDEEALERIQENNLELVEFFDKKRIASKILDFASGPGFNEQYKNGDGEATEKFQADALKKLAYFEDL